MPSQQHACRAFRRMLAATCGGLPVLCSPVRMKRSPAERHLVWTAELHTMLHGRSTSGRTVTVASPSSGPRWWQTRSPPSGLIRCSLLHPHPVLFCSTQASRHVQARCHYCRLGYNQLRNQSQPPVPPKHCEMFVHHDTRNSKRCLMGCHALCLAWSLRMLCCPGLPACQVLRPERTG